MLQATARMRRGLRAALTYSLLWPMVAAACEGTGGLDRTDEVSTAHAGTSGTGNGGRDGGPAADRADAAANPPDGATLDASTDGAAAPDACASDPGSSIVWACCGSGICLGYCGGPDGCDCFGIVGGCDPGTVCCKQTASCTVASTCVP